MVTKSTTTQFPIVDAILVTPGEGAEGQIGICTNTSAPGQVFNEIEEKNRAHVSALGALIVSRDGTERMVLNCLAHPTIRFLILFSEESLTFSPSTNLLLAIQNGVDAQKPGNYIVGGKAASAHFPNLSKKIIDVFRENIIVLPLFMYRNDYSKQIVANYLEWLKPKVSAEVHTFLKTASEKKAIYYDTLNQLITLLAKEPSKKKALVDLDPKEFQHLQPPKIALSESVITDKMPFCVSAEKGQIRVDLEVGGKAFFAVGADEFRLEYSIMRFLGADKRLLSPLQQLVLGAEIARVDTEIKNRISLKSSFQTAKIIGKKQIPIESNMSLVTDKKYYYKMSVRDGGVSVMCLAFDVCEEVFDLRAKSIGAIFRWLAEKNRFEDYEMDFLHRVDVGGQIGRATLAAKLDYAFIQDFSGIFRINKTDLPLLVSDGDSFLGVHKNILMKIYTEGLTHEHGDKQKGTARSGVALAIYRNSAKSLATLPAFYKQGDQSTAEMRANYKQQLLRFDHDGDYSYGERTRKHFGIDQLLETKKTLKKNSKRATIIARFDPTVDMGSYIDPGSGKRKYTHDPCLVYDIFIPKAGKGGKSGVLHSFHIARAHNMVNAYPENIFGLHDAYVTEIRSSLKLKSGDMYMLSNRGNILLLTEEQRTKKILMEPSKPVDDLDTKSGPYSLGEAKKTAKTKTTVTKPDTTNGVVAYSLFPIKPLTKRPKKSFLDRLYDFEGVDTVARAIDYYKQKGVMHNNPALSEYQAGKSDPQADQLAFFQANVLGGKLHATAVFMNRSLSKQKADSEALNYLCGQFSKQLKAKTGNLTVFYVGYTK